MCGKKSGRNNAKKINELYNLKKKYITDKLAAFIPSKGRILRGTGYGVAAVV